jgi:hypothetical protein
LTTAHAHPFRRFTNDANIKSQCASCAGTCVAPNRCIIAPRKRVTRLFALSLYVLIVGQRRLKRRRAARCCLPSMARRRRRRLRRTRSSSQHHSRKPQRHRRRPVRRRRSSRTTCCRSYSAPWAASWLAINTNLSPAFILDLIFLSRFAVAGGRDRHALARAEEAQGSGECRVPVLLEHAAPQPRQRHSNAGRRQLVHDARIRRRKLVGRLHLAGLRRQLVNWLRGRNIDSQ